MIRTRIAPSPTGIPHIGNTRTALYNYLFARKNNGKFILRIEDTDQNRKVEGAEIAIEEILNWLGLAFDEKYVQSERLELYKKHAEELVEKNLAYHDNGAIRFKMPREGETHWQDLVGKKSILFENKNQEDFIILKSDGFPTYHLANVIDDHFMEITHVIRGDEWISSTPKHIQLYNAFEWKTPQFAHLPVILGPDRAKLSKRHGAASILDYREMGYVQEALVNFMALVGWRPSEKSLADQEIFTLKELENSFTLEDVNTASPIFDLQKLEWLSGMWIRRLYEQDPVDVEKRLETFYKNNQSVLKFLRNTEQKILLIKAAVSRMRTLKDFEDLVLEGKARKPAQEERKTAKTLLEKLEKLGATYTDEELLKTMKDVCKETGASNKTLYFLLSGREQGLPLLELKKIYGEEYFIKKLQKLKNS